MRVLMSAYACEPHKGSESGVGWHWAKQAARFHEVWVITRANNRPAIEAELERHPDPNLHFIYVDLPHWLAFWKRGQKGLYPYYCLWQVAIFLRARKLHRQMQFDLVHHVTFGNIWLPTLLPLIKASFVWGPIGGGERIPISFASRFSWLFALKDKMKTLLAYLHRYNIFLYLCCENAKAIILKSKDNSYLIPRTMYNKIIIMTDVGVNKLNYNRCSSNNKNIYCIMVGRLDAWRGFDLAIEAFSLLQPHIKKDRISAKLLILGSGKDKQKLIELTHKLNLEEKVIFTGHVTHEEYLDYLSRSSIYVHPYLKEGGVTVLLDALTCGIPVVCLDIPGIAEIIDDNCGRKIHLINPQQVIYDLSQALYELLSNDKLRYNLGNAGRHKVLNEHSWDSKGLKINMIYNGLLQQRPLL